ncbi:hypothetical protein [Rhizobium lentis]|uniref:hypothetical protein n=1 Tax=Rhizobium lentis TaxID=1138194 RepID=UPI001C837077|nr:hypothetical protein [Rhizobium lentis]MBX4954753.1 hypothetical protein [Rhizobium lentis]MBX5034528.1 hypothetical protein [Rhizobium lentis]
MDQFRIAAIKNDLVVIKDAVARLESNLDALLKGSLTIEKAKELPLKRHDGRLTDAGIAAVNAAFDAGATVTDVARQFGITASASSNRRQIWKSR